MIYVTKPTLPDIDEYVKYLRGIWDRNWLTNNGILLQELEKKLTKYLKNQNISVVSNATLGLLIALDMLDLEGEVITTPFTFAATTNVLFWRNLKPVFADIDSKTFNIKPEDVEKRITKKTSAILAVHVFGNPCDVVELGKIAKKYNIKLIYDAAHAFGVKYNGKPVTSYGDVSVLSFHAVKLFNTVEGGALVAKNKRLIDKANLIRNFGIVSEEEVVLPGINAKMSEFHAAMGLCNLEKIDKNIERNKYLYQKYTKLLDPNKIEFQQLTTKDLNYTYMPILLENKKVRDEVYNILTKNGYAARKYFYPLTSDFKYLKYKDFNKKHDLINAKKVSDGILCLPMYPDLDESVVDKVSELINSTC